jgi:muramidase (phage lysozyme)
MDSNVPAVWRGVPQEIRRFLSCVAAHESSHSPWAENPSSTASGKYQFLDSTWRGIARWTRVGGHWVAREYGRASDAPAWVQEAVAVHSIRDGGWANWNGTHCGHGT